MKAEQFSDALGGISPEYIDEAMEYRAVRVRQRGRTFKALAAVACLALAVYAGARLLYEDAPALPTAGPELPALDINGDDFAGMGSFVMYMGEGFEYLTGNPWREDMGLDTLPVYKNALEHASAELNRVPLNADYASMRALMDEAVAALGVDPDSLEYYENYERTFTDADGGDAVVSSYVAENDEVYILVTKDLSLRVKFKTPVELPVDLADGAAAEDYAEAGEFAAEKYADLLGFEAPRVSVSGGDRDYDGSVNYSVSIYDAGAGDEETVINYNFRRAELSVADGSLTAITLHCPDLSEKVGDYPIISVAEAQELLVNGGELPDTLETLNSEDIAGVELVYLTSEYDEYFIPYYRFYMLERNEARTESVPDGLTAYTWYYVPAIAPQYVK